MQMLSPSTADRTSWKLVRASKAATATDTHNVPFIPIRLCCPACCRPGVRFIHQCLNNTLPASSTTLLVQQYQHYWPTTRHKQPAACCVLPHQLLISDPLCSGPHVSHTHQQSTIHAGTWSRPNQSESNNDQQATAAQASSLPPSGGRGPYWQHHARTTCTTNKPIWPCDKQYWSAV